MPVDPDLHGNILVVDDDQANRDLLVRILTREGFTTRVAPDGETALAQVVAATPDLILLDVVLPGIDGFEVCRRLKAQRSTRLVPIVLVTGLHDRSHRIRGIDSGADDFISKPFDMEELRARVRSLVQLKRYTDELEMAESVILSLAMTIEARDAYTQGHCRRLAAYATALGTAIGLGAEEIAALSRGGFLHDVGKVGISDAILLKPSPLSPDEYQQMKRHTVIGDHLCGQLRSLALVRPIVRSHHERLDGSGYPDALRGDEVPLLAQIVSIADAYDAMTTDRPYRKARLPEQAYDELKAEAAQGLRRTDLVDAFVAVGRRGGLTPPADLGQTQAAALRVVA